MTSCLRRMALLWWEPAPPLLRYADTGPVRVPALPAKRPKAPRGTSRALRLIPHVRELLSGRKLWTGDGTSSLCEGSLPAISGPRGAHDASLRCIFACCQSAMQRRIARE